jgi:purine-binding chemotaxis protein CheW
MRAQDSASWNRTGPIQEMDETRWGEVHQTVSQPEIFLLFAVSPRRTPPAHGWHLACSKQSRRGPRSRQGWWGMTAGAGSRRELMERLVELEAELRTLRRSVLDEARPRLPAAGEGFRALCFEVGDDVYGVALSAVREVVRYVELTRIAEVAACVAGLVNVRGEVLAVIDARKSFGVPARAPRLGTAIAILQHGGRSTGLVVDRVLDVTPIAPDQLSAPSGPLARVHAIAAVATVSARIVQIVDVAALLAASEWEELEAAIALSAPPPESQEVPT